MPVDGPSRRLHGGARRTRRAVRGAAQTRLHGARSDRPRSGDRLRRDRSLRGPADRLDREQDGGHYRLRRRDDEALFGYNVGPHSWKRYQLPSEVRLWRARREQDGGLTELLETPREAPRYAFL